MYVERARSDEIPADAIRLTETEVFEYMTDVVRKWPNTLEIWAIKLGNPILASAVVVSSTIILKFYREKLKLKNFARFTLFIPVVFLPSIYNQIYQNTVTSRSIILQEDCPTCITTQSMFIQFGTGIVYPVISAIAGTYMFGHRMNTFYFKSNGTKMIDEFASHVLKTSRPLYNRLTALTIGHVLLCYAITHYQMENLEFIRFKILQQEREQIENLQRKNSNNNKQISK